MCKRVIAESLQTVRNPPKCLCFGWKFVARAVDDIIWIIKASIFYEIAQFKLMQCLH